MLLALTFLLLSVVSELLFVWDSWWRWRKPAGALTAALLLVANCLIVAATWTEPRAALLTISLSLVSGYSLFNIARAIDGRAGELYLRHAVVTTFAWLGLAHTLLVTLIVNEWYFVPSLKVGLVAFGLLQLVVAIAMTLSTVRQLQATQLPRRLPEISDGKLPTITVAVPVRDEESQMEACLTSILGSNYPKLEVLAFDDHSSDHTPEVIKRFAHAGVRFIRSGELASGWLAKNHAYNRLAEAASGEVILFCGADVRLDTRTLRQLIALLDSEHKDMLAVLPQNRLVREVPLLQAMRYYWEIAPPRRRFASPPVLSSLWLIRRKTLQAAGGFAAVRRSITPEAHLAKYTSTHDDGYSFMRSDERLGVWSEKSNDEQRATAILRRYPQVHRRPEMVLTIALGQALLLLGPPLVVMAAVLSVNTIGIVAAVLVVSLAIVALALHVVSFETIQRGIFVRVRSWKVVSAYLACIALDIWYLHLSMYRYEFGQVQWKGRDVTTPVMRRPAD